MWRAVTGGTLEAITIRTIDLRTSPAWLLASTPILLLLTHYAAVLPHEFSHSIWLLRRRITLSGQQRALLLEHLPGQRADARTTGHQRGPQQRHVRGDAEQLCRPAEPLWWRRHLLPHHRQRQFLRRRLLLRGLPEGCGLHAEHCLSPCRVTQILDEVQTDGLGGGGSTGIDRELGQNMLDVTHHGA